MRHQQVKESIIERFINKFTKKGFYIEVGDEFVYPSSKEVVAAIEKYANKSKEELEFTSKTSPVTFYLDKVLYSSKINMNRGGYFIYCREV